MKTIILEAIALYPPINHQRSPKPMTTFQNFRLFIAAMLLDLAIWAIPKEEETAPCIQSIRGSAKLLMEID